MSDRLDADHAKLYKNSGKMDLGDSRRRRNENSVELRRQRRNDDLMKRRNITFDDNEAEEAEPGTTLAESKDLDGTGTAVGTGKQPLMTIEEAVHILVHEPSIDDLRNAFCGIRRILSSVKNPPIDGVIAAGLLEALVKALQIEDERVQFEAAWALTNIVSGTSEQTVAAVRAGVTPHLVRLCSSTSLKVVEQGKVFRQLQRLYPTTDLTAKMKIKKTIDLNVDMFSKVSWAIANIIGDSPELRDLMIEEGVVPALGRLVDNASHLPVSFVQIVAWAISNIVRHKRPQVPLSILKQVVPIIAALLKYKDTNTQQDTCWALSFMTDGADENMEVALKCGVLPIVVDFLKSGRAELIPPSLRVLGNFATGADHLTQLVVDTKVVETLIPQLMVNSTSSNIKECCWLLSNIVAGTQSQIQYVVNSNVMELVIDVLENGDNRSQVEAGWVLANLVHGGTSEQILRVANIRRAIPAVCAALAVPNNELVANMLEALYGMLQVIHNCEPENVCKVEMIVEESNGLDNLEKLQHHESETIYSLAYKIVNEFFNDGFDDEVENIFSADKPHPNMDGGGAAGDAAPMKFTF